MKMETQSILDADSENNHRQNVLKVATPKVVDTSSNSVRLNILHKHLDTISVKFCTDSDVSKSSFTYCVPNQHIGNYYLPSQLNWCILLDVGVVFEPVFLSVLENVCYSANANQCRKNKSTDGCFRILEGLVRQWKCSPKTICNINNLECLRNIASINGNNINAVRFPTSDNALTLSDHVIKNKVNPQKTCTKSSQYFLKTNGGKTRSDQWIMETKVIRRQVENSIDNNNTQQSLNKSDIDQHTLHADPYNKAQISYEKTKHSGKWGQQSHEHPNEPQESLRVLHSSDSLDQPSDCGSKVAGSWASATSSRTTKTDDSCSRSSWRRRRSRSLGCSSQATVRWSGKQHADRWAAVGKSLLLTLGLLSAIHINAADAKIRARDPEDPVGNIRHVLPELELGNNSITDVRFNLGSTAFLPCRFPSFPRHHENRVSWVRRWDWHILTAGLFTYTNDDRFVVLHKDGSNDWTLQIKFLNNDDNGTYECQVHSGSGFMSQFVNLHVVTPRAVILEPRELTVKNGNNFGLTCIIQQSLEPPVYVMWLHGGVPVNYAPDRPRLNVEMEVKGSSSRSLLTVRDAKYTDSGNYTCTAPNAVNAWVLVYITEGDTVAAVQRRHPDSSSGSSSSSGSTSSGSAGSSGTAGSGGSSSPVTPNSASSVVASIIGPPHRNILLGVILSIALHILINLNFDDFHVRNRQHKNACENNKQENNFNNKSGNANNDVNISSSFRYYDSNTKSRLRHSLNHGYNSNHLENIKENAPKKHGTILASNHPFYLPANCNSNDIMR